MRKKVQFCLEEIISTNVLSSFKWLVGWLCHFSLFCSNYVGLQEGQDLKCPLHHLHILQPSVTTETKEETWRPSHRWVLLPTCWNILKKPLQAWERRSLAPTLWLHNQPWRNCTECADRSSQPPTSSCQFGFICFFAEVTKASNLDWGHPLKSEWGCGNRHLCTKTPFSNGFGLQCDAPWKKNGSTLLAHNCHASVLCGRQAGSVSFRVSNFQDTVSRYVAFFFPQVNCFVMSLSGNVVWTTAPMFSHDF